MRSTRKETTHIKRLYDDNEKFRTNISKDIGQFYSEVKVRIMSITMI